MPVNSRLLLALCVLGLVGAVLTGCGASADAPTTGWRAVTVDADGPHDPWGKAVGDINGDGLPDMVVGGHGPQVPPLWKRALGKLGLLDDGWSEGLLVWYESPDWTRHVVSTEFRIRTDIEVADIDGDGRRDIVAVTDAGIVWFRSPDWTPGVIDTRVLHDVEVADLDGDGRPDLVARDQALFGHNSGDRVHVYRQETPQRWHHAERAVPQGEGLKVADLDGDGRPDLIVNQVWFANSGRADRLADWPARSYCPSWLWPHAFIDVADMNADGRPDVVLTPAEPAGQSFRLSWCEAPERPDGQWIEHVVDPKVETVMHSVLAGDFNLDGRTDIAMAAMQQGIGPEDVAVYLQGPRGQPWSRQVIGTRGSHTMKAFDFDQDGDLDLMGAHWSGDHQPVELWENTLATRTAPGWRRHVIDGAKPWRSLFVASADLNGDGRLDIVSGGSWYRNPGRLEGHWARQDLGAGANNMLLLHDVDRDGDADVLASTWDTPREWTLPERLRRQLGQRPWPERGGLVWAMNDGHGRFQVARNVEAGRGDFAQGAALLGRAPNERIVLSWHEPRQGLQQWQRADRPTGGAQWRVSDLSRFSQDEALSVADLDGDGVDDLVLGTRWLGIAPDGATTLNTLFDSRELPDRNRVGDIDGDGQADVVIGYEAVSRPGKLAWYGRGHAVTDIWSEHVIARPVGPMSLDLADMDGDGDLDVIVGEHNLRHPAAARLLWFENRRGDGRLWVPHTIHTGDEHHDGAHVVDLDGDGDLDIVSIGWGHDRLIVYENLSVSKP